MRCTCPPSWSTMTSSGSRRPGGRGIDCSRRTSCLPAARLGRFSAKRITPASSPRLIIRTTCLGGSVPPKPATMRWPASPASGNPEATLGGGPERSLSSTPKAKAAIARPHPAPIAIRLRLVLTVATAADVMSDSGAGSPASRPDGRLALRPMPPLISFEEALALGELTDHEQIGELVERAWAVRRENFGDSTDMCSLVNAKSGGCAEDCGFCAQSRYAEADTPMHAMMEPEQILEHAKAAEAAGAHRFCMVTQGQGLSKRDFQKILEGAELVAEQTNLKRCASIGHMSVERAKALREAGIQRVHHNVESARSYYPEVSTTVRYEGRLRTIDAVKEAGLETCVGGILNLGETEEQRVEMAFELAKIDPTSVPINLLNPRPGTKFGDRELMDPWEVVKWVAIFRLILPGALFRLCGGRVENLGDLQSLAVKAGLNGVMMGNFLTTLGAEPEDDRAMFEDLGLNVARQPDNGANPRPDNRDGWLDGETPATPIDELIDHQDEANLWDPSTQLRVVKKTKKPPPYPASSAA